MLVSVVIPAYNEEEGIKKSLQLIKKNKKYNYEIIVVDNNSSDNTSKVAKALGATVVFQPIQGYGSAYKAGLVNAHGDVIITGDADATYPFDKIDDLIDIYLSLKSQNNKLFINTDRFFRLEKNSMSFLHKIGNFILTFFSNLIFNTKINDSQSGMWIFDKNLVNLLDFNIMSNGMPFSQEIKIFAKKLGYKIIEVPIIYRKRIGEKKLSSFRDGFVNLFSLFLFRLKV